MKKVLNFIKSNSKIVIALLLFLISVLGATYAYFQLAVTGNDDAKNMVVETGVWSITYVDGPEMKLIHAYPGEYIEKTVYVTNTGTVPVSYEIDFKSYMNNFINDELVISYTCQSYKNYGKNNQTQYGTCYDLEEEPLRPDNFVVNDGILIDVAVTHVIKIKIEFKETGSNQNSNQGAYFQGVLQINNGTDAFNVVAQFVDGNGTPLSNKTAEFHSKVRYGVTDEYGIVSAPSLMVGEHSIYLKNGSELLAQSGIEIQASSSFNISNNIVYGKTGDLEVPIKIHVVEGQIQQIESLEFSYLTFKLSGGDISQTYKNRYPKGTELTIPNPTRDGYTFTGWQVTGGTIKNGVLTLEKELVTLTASWTANGYKLSLNSAGGVFGSTEGWTVDSQVCSLYNFTCTISTSVTYYTCRNSYTYSACSYTSSQDAASACVTAGYSGCGAQTGSCGYQAGTGTFCFNVNFTRKSDSAKCTVRCNKVPLSQWSNMDMSTGTKYKIVKSCLSNMSSWSDSSFDSSCSNDGPYYKCDGSNISSSNMTDTYVKSYSNLENDAYRSINNDRVSLYQYYGYNQVVQTSACSGSYPNLVSTNVQESSADQAVTAESVSACISNNGCTSCSQGSCVSQQSSGISKTVTFGELYGSLPTPTKAGSEFQGWYTESNGGTKVTADTVININANHTLYAHWS